MNEFQCQAEGCDKKDALIFHCNYCGDNFCEIHHLPENHNCKSQPKIAPFHVRPQEVKTPKPSAISYPPANQHSIGMKNKPKAVLAIGIALVVFACFLLILGAIVPSPTIPSPTTTPTAPTPTLTTPYAPNTPQPTLSYVEVDYQTVGWFYGNGFVGEDLETGKELPDPDYNYTYLVLNVTITNHGYSQVNVIGGNGFAVVINNNNYQSLRSMSVSLLSLGTVRLTNNNSSFLFYDLFESKLPNPATLLDTGSVNGLVFFQFGSPTVYPQQPQILNEPFALQYSVTYGNDATLFEPYATVVINQK